MAKSKLKKKPVKQRIATLKKKMFAKKEVVKGELKYIPWNSVELEDLNPFLQRQMIVGQDIMVARVLMKKGCIVPEHSHHNEQVTYILEGALKFWIDGKEIVVNAGEVLTIPPHMPHKAEALVETVDLDVFTPVVRTNSISSLQPVEVPRCCWHCGSRLETHRFGFSFHGQGCKLRLRCGDLNLSFRPCFSVSVLTSHFS
jgi:quercetin dioxygenase-like cupin family protein